MSLIEHTLEGKIDKVKIALDRIKAFEPSQFGYDTPFYVCYSGGKDSDALRILFELSGVPYDLVHNHTTVDAPETVYYIRSIPKIQISYPKISMWNLIVKKKMPPTRLVRYCCSELKERGGENRFCATGVRWAESNKRQSRGSVEVVTSKIKNKVILNADNDISRKLLDTCQVKGKRVLNPIIDWSDAEIWEFLSYYGCKSNPLYECGYKRVGCLGCPISRNQKTELETYPKYKANYIRTFQRMIDVNADVPYNWKSGEEVYNWWVSNVRLPKQLENQISFEDWS